MTGKYIRELKRLARKNNVPFKIGHGHKHRRLIIDGKTVLVFNEHYSGKNDLKGVESIIRRYKEKVL
jgi:hypothetical protein